MLNRTLAKIKKTTPQSKKTASHRTYGDPRTNPKSTEFEVNNWIMSEFVINELVPVVGWHPFPLSELILMSGAVVRFQPKAIFEWGTHIGKSARVFYETIKAFDVKCTVHSFDLPDDIEHVEHPHEQRGMLVKNFKEVKLYQEDGVNGALKVTKKYKLKDKDLLFFVDGDHSYESVKRELNAIMKNHPGAKVLLHDTLYQSKDSGYNIGPWKAIDEFLKKHKEYKSISTTTGLPGMTLIF
jgi:cephalosporin hydroxylase